MNCNKCGADLTHCNEIKCKLDDNTYCFRCFYKYFLGAECPDGLNDTFIPYKNDDVIT